MAENPDLIRHVRKGIARGTARHFSVTDSDYLNINLDSTEEIKALLESRSKMIILHIESSKAGIDTTQITIGGLKPNTTYYLYEDHLNNHNEFKADENGSYSFVQDISRPHLILVQTNASTYYLYETGFVPASIGTWDPVTRIARLTTDINQTLEIDVNNATLTGLKPDNTKHVISVAGGAGVFISEKLHISIENIEIKACTDGIYVDKSTNILIQNNSIHNNSDNGINFTTNNTSNTIQYNFIYSNGTQYRDAGISFDEYNNSNTIQYNNIYDNTNRGIYFSSNNDSNIIQNNLIYSNDSAGIVFGEENNSNTIQYNNIYKNDFSGIIFTDSSNSNNILCNYIFNNGTSSNFGGAYIHGDNNLIKHNNFVGNEPFNAYNYGPNTYSGNYWSDWDKITIPYAFPDKGFDYSPAAFPVSCTLFKQFSVQE